MLATAPSRLSDLELADETHRLLEALPDATISAVSSGGVWIAMPPDVPLRGQTVARGHTSALELVVAGDLRLVIDAWQDVHVIGTSRVEVRPLGGGATITMRYVDARAQYGVFLCFLVGADALIPARRGDAGAMRPRLAVVRKNQQAVFTAVDESAVLILGHTDLVGRRNVELVHPDDAPRAIANWMDMLTSPGQSRRVRLRQQHRDGHWIWFEVTNHNRLDDPTEQCVVAEMIDISEEMAAQEFLRSQEDLLRRLTDSLPVGVVQIDADSQIVHRNLRLTEIIGQPDATTVGELFASLAEQYRARFADAVEAALDGANCDMEVSVRHPDGALLRCNLIIRPLLGRGAFVCVDDVTEAARLRDELRHRATYDPLTGCHNRASVLLEVEQALDSASASTGGVAVAFIDLDGFKTINDQCGHAAGDRLLSDIGRCLERVVRSGDIVGRIGGDEFIACSTAIACSDQAVALGDRLSAALAAGFQPAADHLAVASIGVAWVSGAEAHTTDAYTLIERADAAMYRAKADGTGRAVLAS